MLAECFEAEQAKKAKEADKEAVDKNELTVLIRGLGKDSKEKKKTRKLNDGCNLTTPPDAPPAPNVFQSGLMAIHELLKPKEEVQPPEKKRKAPYESQVEEQLKQIYEHLDTQEFYMTAGVNFYKLSDSNLIVYEDISKDVILATFCTPGKDFSVDYFKSEMTSLGVSKLHCIQLYSLLSNEKDHVLSKNAF
jgi:hypothetical protein